MRKYIPFLMIFVLLPLAFAQENSLQDPGVTPDSLLWGVDIALEQISLLLAANPEAKARKGLEIAQERLLEIKAMAEEKNLPALEKAHGAHSKILLTVKKNVQLLDEEDPELLLEKELELEKELLEHEEEIEEVEMKLKVKIKIEGQLTAEQQAQLDEFLASLGGSAENVKIEIKNKKDETKLKIKTKTGKSDEEIEQDIQLLEIKKGLLEEKVKIRAEVVDGKTIVKVEQKFETKTTGEEALLSEILEKFSLSAEEAALLLKIETEEAEQAEDQDERLKVKVKIEEGLSEVEVKLRFVLNSIEEAAILGAVVEKTQLTEGQVEAVWRVKEEKVEEEKEEKEIEIEVEIEDGEAEVEVKSDGNKMKFVLQETDREKIVQEIALRLEVSVEEVLKLVTFEEEKDDNDDGEVDDKDDEDADEENDKSGKKNIIGSAVKGGNSEDSENEDDDSDSDSDDSDSNGGSSGSSESGDDSGSSDSGGSSGGGSDGGSSSGSSGSSGSGSSGGGNGGNGGDD
ncbi:MAG: DUF5667 domain-containing protein [Nanoarchaeota archaeon]|nr:DUF5667 domain-containing protein [Nanoarchaeota archaeon]